MLKISILVFWVSAFELPNVAFAQDQYLMGVMGDSISAATFANHSAQAEVSRESATEDVYRAMPEEGPTQSPRRTTAEFSRSFDTTKVPAWMRIPFLGKWENKRTYSWASGQLVNSHFLRLGRWLASQNSALSVYNVAVPGAMTMHLKAQADKIVAAMQTGRYKALKYVTLMIGANDACSFETASGTPNEKMLVETESALRTLGGIQQAEPIRILISSIPKIPDLATDEMLNLQTVAGMTCGQLRDRKIHECDPMTQWTNESGYRQKISVIAEKNRMLRTLIAEMNTELPQLDIVYSDAFFRAEIKPSFLARDCFHPGRVGHEELAERLWENQPWFK